MDKSPINYYYHPIPGSRSLVTHRSGGQKELSKIEKAGGNETVEVIFNGETLHKFPISADLSRESIEKRLENLDPLQQTVFFHIYLLAAARGADWCRVGMTELARRTRMSRRRLLRALSDLAQAGKIKPIDRDRNGTLYKVYSITEKHIVGEPSATRITEESKVEKPTPKKARAKKTAIGQRKKPIESPINEEFYPKKQKVVTIKDIAKSFFENTGIAFDDVLMDEAIGQITYLLEDGFTRDEVLTGVQYLARQFGKKAAIDKLPYYIHQAIEADKG